MTSNNQTQVQNKSMKWSGEDVFLKRIPDDIYNSLVDKFRTDYNFQNGERMRISNYYVGISRELSNIYMDFIHKMLEGINNHKYPIMSAPEGFKPQSDNLLQTELKGGFTLGSFDMAVTSNGLQNIEFQAIATYPISAAIMNKHLLDHMDIKDAFIFADSPETSWADFLNIYKNIIGGNASYGVVLTDRNIKKQKTNFEFFATKKEIDIPLEIVDLEDIFERDGGLYYHVSPDRPPIKITRLYNRILLAEALFEDNYPQDSKMWNFRYDHKYDGLKFINHPIKQFEISKRLSPYIDHPFNPECFELKDVVQDFRSGKLKYEEYIWKHKWGAAGHRLIFNPSTKILDDLSEHWNDYIAQKKVNFKIFKTDDGQEKIVELRFMTAIHNDNMVVVPMARIGHVSESSDGNKNFHIHFADNNKIGYGFAPVCIF